VDTEDVEEEVDQGAHQALGGGWAYINPPQVLCRMIKIKDSHNLTVVGSWSVSTLTFLGPAYEGGDHLLSLAAFPSTKYTQGVLI